MATLLTLPPDLQFKILCHLPPSSLHDLSETCRHFRALSLAPALWRALLLRRWRAAPAYNATSLRSPRDVYRAWHSQRRLPAGRAGALGAPFASATRGGALGWVAVRSTADCRVPEQGLGLRLVMQNVAEGEVLVRLDEVLVRLAAGRVLRVEGAWGEGGGGAAGGGGGEARVQGVTVVDRAGTGGCGACGGGRAAVNARVREVALARDDYLVLGVAVRLPATVHEVDVLERMQCVEVGVRCGGGGTGGVLRAEFVQSSIWDAYEHMPGDWWYRKDGSGHRRGGTPGL